MLGVEFGSLFLSAIFFSGYLVWSAVMWRLFIAGMHDSGSALAGVALNSSANFVASVRAGRFPDRALVTPDYNYDQFELLLR